MFGTQRHLLLLAFFVLLGSLGFSRQAAAQVSQSRVAQQHVAPYRPKLSPYLDLLRNDNSILNPYHSFVLPRRELHQQQARQAGEISRLEQATFGRFAPNAPSQTSRLPTGRGGRFQTYLHFYDLNHRP